MFDPKKAFESLDGQSFTYPELMRALEAIRADQQNQVPAEIRARDLLELATQENWLRQEDGPKPLLLQLPGD